LALMSAMRGITVTMKLVGGAVKPQNECARLNSVRLARDDEVMLAPKASTLPIWHFTSQKDAGHEHCPPRTEPHRGFNAARSTRIQSGTSFPKLYRFVSRARGAFSGVSRHTLEPKAGFWEVAGSPCSGALSKGNPALRERLS
jgi:hypothetical protein